MRNVKVASGGLVMALFVAVGCGGEPADTSGGNSGSQAADVQSTTSALMNCGYTIPDGYYQPSGEPNIYRVTGSQSCWVYDPGQLSALQHRTNAGYNGFSNYTDFAVRNCGVNFLGHCHYPAGMYRAKGHPEVYFLTSGNPATGTYCHVTDNAQVGRLGGWNQVLLVYSPADFSESNWLDANGVPHAGRPYTGDCTY